MGTLLIIIWSSTNIAAMYRSSLVKILGISIEKSLKKHLEIPIEGFRSTGLFPLDRNAIDDRYILGRQPPEQHVLRSTENSSRESPTGIQSTAEENFQQI
jgi:hypothetical protein